MKRCMRRSHGTAGACLSLAQSATWKGRYEAAPTFLEMASCRPRCGCRRGPCTAALPSAWDLLRPPRPGGRRPFDVDRRHHHPYRCLLYTSDAADDLTRVDLG